MNIFFLLSNEETYHNTNCKIVNMYRNISQYISTIGYVTPVVEFYQTLLKYI